MTYDGKKVFTRDEFDCSKARPGDYVEQEVVDDAMNIMPPACMRSDCAQLGEPYSHREDPESYTWRATYFTFKRVSNHVWQYCGKCFRGENTERGKEPYYVTGGEKYAE